jgi:hypothetical protein
MTTQGNAHAFTPCSLFQGAYARVHSIDLQTKSAVMTKKMTSLREMGDPLPPFWGPPPVIDGYSRHLPEHPLASAAQQERERINAPKPHSLDWDSDSVRAPIDTLKTLSD